MWTTDLPTAALALEAHLFCLRHRFRGDPRARGAPITRQQLIAKAPLQKKFFALGERHVNGGVLPIMDSSQLRRSIARSTYFWARRPPCHEQ